MDMNKFNLYIIVISINTIIILYFIYLLFQNIFSHNIQGKKLRLKQNQNNTDSKYDNSKNANENLDSAYNSFFVNIRFFDFKKVFFFLLILSLSYYWLLQYLFKDIVGSKNYTLEYFDSTIDIIQRYPILWKDIYTYFSITNLLVIFLLSIFFIVKKYKKLLRKNVLVIHTLDSKYVLKYNYDSKYANGFAYIFSKMFLKKCVLDKSVSTNTQLEKIVSDDLPYLFVGFDENMQEVFLENDSLKQNILVTGSIGTGKTSSAMYNFTKQILEYKACDSDKKIGGLILDVKGNYSDYVKKVCSDCGRFDDLYVISMDGSIKYNPLDKPHLKAHVLANRLKYILELFSTKSSESFWIDKAAQILTEAIKYVRGYNDGYVTFLELHKVINQKEYFDSKKECIRKNIFEGKYTKEQIYILDTSIDFFENEFFKLDDRTSSILKSEISRITGLFVSDYEINKIFCPKKEEITFDGFSDAINNGKIVSLNMNVSEYGDISRLIATYLKIDFQEEILMQLKDKKQSEIRTNVFICDEYQEYVTKNDAQFYSKSRESNCINIISTQSYSSIKQTLQDQDASNVVIQSLVNKIWFRNDDIYTIESAQKMIGKEEKTRTSTSISESSKESNYNYIMSKFTTTGSNLSESINTYTNFDYILDAKDFSQNLQLFQAIVFFTNSKDTTKIAKVKMIPYFMNE